VPGTPIPRPGCHRLGRPGPVQQALVLRLLRLRRGESRGERSQYEGCWYYSGGRYYFDIDARDRDRQNTYVDFSYHDNGGWHTRRFSTGGHGEWKFNISARGGFDGFRTHIGEGNSRDFDWGNYYRHSF
jgi:hypothetical protein